jgi:hypothetical protein
MIFEELLQEAYAYHGTPHEFDAFSMDKIGEGEGFQTYGWGLYFTDTFDVATKYRDKISQFFIDGKNLKTAMSDQFDIETYKTVRDIIALAIMDNEGDTRAIKDELSQYRNSDVPAWRTAYNITKDAKQIGAKGIIYKVNMKLDTKNDLLDMDKPLIQQSGGIKNKLIALSQSLPPASKVASYIDSPNMIKKITGADIYKGLVSEEGTDKRASMKLLDTGIKGMMYLDKQSRPAGKGTHNYTIFDDKYIKIVDRVK